MVLQATSQPNGATITVLDTIPCDGNLHSARVLVQTTPEVTIGNLDFTISDSRSTCQRDASVTVSRFATILWAGVLPNEQLSPGALVCLNDDDDNSDTIEDNHESQGQVIGEDDLAFFWLIGPPAGVDHGTLTLRIEGAHEKVRLFRSRDRTQPVSFDDSPPGAPPSVTRSVSEFPRGVYFIEGVFPSNAVRDIEISLTYTDTLGACQESISVTVFDVNIEVNGTAEVDELKEPGIQLATNNYFNEGKGTNTAPIPDSDDPSPVSLDSLSLELRTMIPFTVNVLPPLQGEDFEYQIELRRTLGIGEVRALAIRNNPTWPYIDDWSEIRQDEDVRTTFTLPAWDDHTFYLEGISPNSTEVAGGTRFAADVTTRGNFCRDEALLNIIEYDVIELRYKTFIASPTVSVLPNIGPYFEGDNRTFSYDLGTSRSFQSYWITASNAMPVATPNALTDEHYGTTRQYNNEDGNGDGVPDDVNACFHCLSIWGEHCILPTASAECVATQTAGLSMISSRVSTDVVKFSLRVDGTNPCFPGPAINANFDLFLRQRFEDGVLYPLEYRVEGDHDGFPWHEVYLRMIRIYAHDVCATGDTPTSLANDAEWDYKDNDPSLDDWQQLEEE